MINIKAFNGLSYMDIEKELDQMYKEPGGLDKVAALALQPLQEDVLYESRARSIFAQYDLAPGEEAVFDGDVRVPGVALSVNGLPYQVQIVSNRVRIDTAPITAKALVRWNESNYRKFDMLDWTQARAKSSLLEQEDAKAISVLDAASTLYNKAITAGTTKLTLESIAEGVAVVADNLRTPASKLVIPTYRVKDLLLLSNSSGYPIFVPAIQEEQFRKGVVGTIFGVEVISIPKKQDGTSIINANTAYVVGPKELVGVVAVRSEITPKTQVSVKDDGDLIAFWEDIGFYCRYTKGIVKITIPTA